MNDQEKFSIDNGKPINFSFSSYLCKESLDHSSMLLFDSYPLTVKELEIDAGLKNELISLLFWNEEEKIFGDINIYKSDYGPVGILTCADPACKAFFTRKEASKISQSLSNHFREFHFSHTPLIYLNLRRDFELEIVWKEKFK